MSNYNEMLERVEKGLEKGFNYPNEFRDINDKVILVVSTVTFIIYILVLVYMTKIIFNADNTDMEQICIKKNMYLHNCIRILLIIIGVILAFNIYNTVVNKSKKIQTYVKTISDKFTAYHHAPMLITIVLFVILIGIYGYLGSLAYQFEDTKEDEMKCATTKLVLLRAYAVIAWSILVFQLRDYYVYCCQEKEEKEEKEE